MNKNYTLVKEKDIKAQSIKLSLYQHNVTGMNILFIKKVGDKNKSFNASFHTPSPEQAGTTHILEHIVLGGSKKYPVKDPFFEIIKGSQANQINASTYENKTKYYFSTTNERDFENLLDVYLDSIFDPLISFDTFSREAYREIYNKETGKIEPQGIVYNEMQSVLDSVDFVIAKENIKTLLPQYNYDFGGDPEHIHNITHEKVIDYYKKYYHPSNANITFYGDEFDFESISAKLDNYLKKYKLKEIEINPKVNKVDKIEHNVVKFYPALQDDGLHHVTKGFLMPEGLTLQEELLIEFLCYSLVISDNSIFKEELLSTGYGESVISDGYTDSLPRILFYTGLKNVKQENIPRVKDAIEEAMQIYYSHLTAKKVVQALKKIKYDLLKNHESLGIHYSNLIDNRWNLGKDPFETLDIAKEFNEIEKKIKNNDNLVKKAFAKYFLKNEEICHIEFAPNTLLKKEFIEKEEQRLADVLNNLSKKELTELSKNSEALLKNISAKDTAKALKTIPRLNLSDIGEFSKYPIYHTIIDENNLRVLQLKENEPNISNYVMTFKVDDIQSINLHYLGLYANVVLRLDTITKSYQEIASSIENTIGELECETYSDKTEFNGDVFTVSFTMSCLDENIKKSFEIFRDILFNVRFTNKKRIKELVFEEYLELKEQIKYRSIIYSHTRALAGINSRFYFKDNTDGLGYYFFIKELSENFDDKIDTVIRELERIHDYLVCRKLFISFSSNEDQHFDQFRLCAKGNDLGTKLEQLVFESYPNLVLDIGGNVNSNAYAISLADRDPKITILSKYLARDYLYNKIRVGQGAYGVSSAYFNLEQALMMVSFADPELEKTFDIFEKKAKTAIKDLNKEKLENTIISILGSIEAPVSMLTKCKQVLKDHLTGIDPEYYSNFKQSIYTATLEDLDTVFKNTFASKNMLSKSKVVIGNQDSAVKHFKKTKEDFELRFL